MKRASDDSQDPPTNESRPPRRVPVSCHFCRTKKLKCDRQFPCSNCRARRLSCVSSSRGKFGEQGLTATVNPSPAASVKSAAAQPSSTVATDEIRENINELKARLQRLEELVSENEGEKLESTSPPPISTNHAEPGREDIESSKDMDLLEMVAFEEHLPFDYNHEEGILQQFASSIMPIAASVTRPVTAQHSLSVLPSRRLAELLLDYFAGHITIFYHIIHVPTVRTILNRVYNNLESNRKPQHDHMALLSTIFALGAYFGSSAPQFQFKSTEAKSLWIRWILLAQQELCAARYIVHPTVETLQSVILIAAFLVPHMSTMSTFRMLMASALQGALQMSLHQIDSASNKKLRQNASVNWAEIESKRRIWWHLASTDWILAFMGTPRCGMYMVHPQHMTVDLPGNVDDKDINSTGHYAQPLDAVSTDMTYSILRSKVSIIVQQIVDAAIESGSTQEEVPYDLVLKFDAMLNRIFEDSHSSFRMAPQSRGQSGNPDLRLQRLFGNVFNRLHRPYLARGARDPKYSYSRMVCLRTARSVIECCKEMAVPNEEFQHTKMWILVHPLFNSVLVLVKDYCLNRNEPREEERKAELLEGFGLLEACQEDSMLARRGLQQMRQLLKGSCPTRNESSGSMHGNVDVLKMQGSHTKQEDLRGLAVPSSPQRHGSSDTATLQVSQWPEPFPQYNWTDVDFTPLENMDFDIGLDESQFEALFGNFE